MNFLALKNLSRLFFATSVLVVCSLTPTETQMGSFGEVDPTMINNLAGKYQIGYGCKKRLV